MTARLQRVGATDESQRGAAEECDGMADGCGRSAERPLLAVGGSPSFRFHCHIADRPHAQPMTALRQVG